MGDWYVNQAGEMERAKLLSRSRAKITPMPSGFCRAHVWTPKGYSTRTFRDPADAKFWADVTMEK